MIKARMSLPCVFHRVPDCMMGDTLYPLNDLRALAPDLYARAAEKYSWRMDLMKQEVYPLRCLWNDVLHFAPLHPEQTLLAFQKIVPILEKRSLSFYIIPIDRFDVSRLCWFRPDPRPPYGRTRMEPSEFEAFKKFELVSDVPDAQIHRWRSDLNDGRPPLFWSGTPHLLYRGPVSVRGLEIVHLELPKNK